MSDSTQLSDLQSQIEELRILLNRAMGRIGQLEGPQGRLFISDNSNPGFTHRAMLELIPNYAGNDLKALETVGRTVSGTTDPGVFLGIPGLVAGEALMLGFSNGTNKVYVPVSDQLRYGKIITVADCKNYCIVKECQKNGTLLSDTLITIAPTQGSCDTTATGFCYEVGDVIVYMRSPDDPTEGFQVAAHHPISIGIQCGEAEGGPTNLAHIDHVDRIEFYSTDFFVAPSSTCSGPTNLAQVNWRGCIVTSYGGTACGATNTAGTGGVKVFDFSEQHYADGGSTTNSAFINFEVVCATTSANVPTLGGSPCIDNSLPKVAKIKGYFGTDTFIKSIDSATGVCNTNTGHIDITLSVTTARACVPFPPP